MKFADIELPSNKKFGYFFTVVFAVVGAYFFWKASSSLSYFLFGLSALFAVITLLKADALLPLNKLWMGLGLLIGMVVSPIVLGLIFFVLFTPISLVMKLVGRDELRLKRVERQSYWKPKIADASASGTFKNQF
jgi:hypothetical protein